MTNTLIKYIRSILTAIITSSLLWSLWGNYNAFILTKGLELECQTVLIRRQKQYQRDANNNALIARFQKNKSTQNPKFDSDIMMERLDDHFMDLTNNSLVDSINYYYNKSVIENYILFSINSYGSACFYDYPAFYKEYGSDNIYLGSPLDDHPVPLVKFDLYINGNPVNMNYKDGYVVPKADSYNIEMDITRIELFTGTIDTTRINKLVKSN